MLSRPSLAPKRKSPHLGPGALHSLPRPVLLKPALTRGPAESRVPSSSIFHGDPFSQEWRRWKWRGWGCHQNRWHLGGGGQAWSVETQVSLDMGLSWLFWASMEDLLGHV